MRRFILASLFAGAVVGSTFACSAVLDSGDFTVRKTGTDAGNDSGGVSCAVNADCAGLGEYFICQKTALKCTNLLSEDCTKVLGDYKNDNAVIFGSLAPTTGPDESTGLPIQNSIELAIGDFTTQNDLPAKPGTTARRPIAVVSCSDASEDANAVRAATHLSKDVGVPAIIGAAFSGITIKVATEVTIPAGTLLISPSATSVSITDLQDNNLVWRTSPSDVIQAQADIAFFPSLEAAIKANNLGEPIKVAIANKGDAYGSGLADAVSSGLQFNGASALSQSSTKFFSFNYGDATPDFPTAITGVVNAQPNVVFLLGTTETLTDMMTGIEAAWPENGPARPVYVMADGSFVSEAQTIAAASTKNLRARILGTIPGTSNANFQKFTVLYNSKIKDGTLATTGGAANAYDALYNLAYSVVAAGDKPITGATLAEGFARQVDKAGGILDVGASNINTAIGKLSSGQGFDFNGASGPLDYDITKGEASSDIQLWCLPQAENGAPAAPKQIPTVYYDALNKVIVPATDPYGALKTACNL